MEEYMYDKKTIDKEICVISAIKGEKSTKITTEDGSVFFDRKHGDYNQGASYFIEYTVSEYTDRTGNPATANWIESYKIADGAIPVLKNTTNPEQKSVLPDTRETLIVRQSSNKLVADVLAESGRIMEKAYRNKDYSGDIRKIIDEQIEICDDLLKYVINKASIVDEAVNNGRKFN